MCHMFIALVYPQKLNFLSIHLPLDVCFNGVILFHFARFIKNLLNFLFFRSNKYFMLSQECLKLFCQTIKLSKMFFYALNFGSLVAFFLFDAFEVFSYFFVKIFIRATQLFFDHCTATLIMFFV